MLYSPHLFLPCWQMSCRSLAELRASHLLWEVQGHNSDSAGRLGAYCMLKILVEGGCSVAATRGIPLSSRHAALCHIAHPPLHTIPSTGPVHNAKLLHTRLTGARVREGVDQKAMSPSRPTVRGHMFSLVLMVIGYHSLQPWPGLVRFSEFTWV